MTTPSIPDITLPQAISIDYTDLNAICRYQQQLCTLYGQCGGFQSPAPSGRAIRSLLAEGSIWLDNVRSLISGILRSESSPLTLAAIPDLLDSYDLLHRICNGQPCYDYLRQVRLTAVQQWLKGDRSISQTDVVLMIAREADRDIRHLEPRYSHYLFQVLQQWIDELNRYGRFRSLPIREAARRLRYLLDHDLFAYLGSRQQAIKHRWLTTALPTSI